MIKVYDVQGELLEVLGVHMYTTYMTSLMQTLLAQESAKNATVIDWSNRADASSSTLIDWVKNSPAGQQIFVFLPSRHHPDTHTLQNTLQSLGCTVTRKFLSIASK